MRYGAIRRHAALAAAVSVVAVTGAGHAVPPLPVLATGTTTRISTRVDGSQAIDTGRWEGYVEEPAVSAGGRYVVFYTAMDLGFPGCGGRTFVRDLTTGKLDMVSAPVTKCTGPSGIGYSYSGITPDGRFVSFASSATDLVRGFPNRRPGDMETAQVYVRDRHRRRTVPVSVGVDGRPANWNAYRATISDDGRFVVFESQATNLVRGDHGDPNLNGPDVFLRDLRTGRTERVGPRLPDGEGGRFDPAISGNGRYVVFSADSGKLAPHKGTGSQFMAEAHGQVYVWDRITRRTELVSRNDAGYAADSLSFSGSITGQKISRDGRYIAYYSDASNLAPSPIPAGTPASWAVIRRDVYLYDRVLHKTTRVSAAADGTPGDDASAYPCISPDGRWVSYVSYASNLGDVDLSPRAEAAMVGADIYLFDRVTRTNRLVTRSTEGVQADLDSYQSCPSDGGKVVVFVSKATTLVEGDTNLQPDAFVHRYG